MTGKIPPHAARLHLLDRSGWSTVADRVIHGLCHDLSGRASALAGLTYLLTSRGGERDAVEALVSQELEELEGAIRLFRLLPDDPAEAELLAPGEELEGVIGLVRTQRGLEDIEIRLGSLAQTPAIRWDRTLFLRSLALLLTRSAEVACLAGSRTVAVRGYGKEEGLCLDIEVPGRQEGGGGRGMELARPALPEEMEAGLGRVLAEEGITLTGGMDPEAGGAFQLFFPPPFSS